MILKVNTAASDATATWRYWGGVAEITCHGSFPSDGLQRFIDASGNGVYLECIGPDFPDAGPTDLILGWVHFVRFEDGPGLWLWLNAPDAYLMEKGVTVDRIQTGGGAIFPGARPNGYGEHSAVHAPVAYGGAGPVGVSG